MIPTFEPTMNPIHIRHALVINKTWRFSFNPMVINKCHEDSTGAMPDQINQSIRPYLR